MFYLIFPDRNHPWRVFETVKVVNKAVRQRSRCHSPGLPGSSPASARSSCSSTPRTSYYGSDSASLTLEDKPSCRITQKTDNRCVLTRRMSMHHHITVKVGMRSNQGLRNTRLTLFIATVVQSVWASRAHQEVRTLKLLCAACQHASRATPLTGLSSMWSASVNSTPWRPSATSTKAPAVS